MIGQTQPATATLTPGKGGREIGIPCDPATFTGTSGIHFNTLLGATEILMGLPLAVANNTGAVYFSAIHGALGSDARNPLALPAAGFNPNKPAFANPEVTGYYVPPAVLSSNTTQNGFFNTEKVLRSSSDNPALNGTVWQELQGRTRLNFSLWISAPGGAASNDIFSLELYRDLNTGDKIAGKFGAGTGPTDPRNAQLIGQWSGPSANRDQNQPNLATRQPFDLPAGCNLYLLFRSQAGNVNNLAVGSIWFS